MSVNMWGVPGQDKDPLNMWGVPGQDENQMNTLHQQNTDAILRPLSVSRLDQLNNVHNQNQSRLPDVQSYIGGLVAEGEMYQKECTRLQQELEKHKITKIKERSQYLMKMVWATDSTFRNMLFVKWRNIAELAKKDRTHHDRGPPCKGCMTMNWRG